MPGTTPSRGYPYPLYDEPTMDFPTAIEDLATAVDTDVANLETFIDGGFNRPSARIFSAAVQNITTATTTTVSWTGASVDYDNDAMANLTGTGGLNLTTRGVYELSAMITLSLVGAGPAHSLSLSFVSTGGVSANPARVSIAGSTTQETWLSLTALHYHTGTGTDSISLQVWHNQGSTLPLRFRQMTAVKTSNLTGGF